MNATSAGRSPASLPPIEELLILAVDDTPANLVALERVLGGVGARVVRASSGEEALGLCLRHRFALAILDVQMPEMDGFELLTIMKQDAILKDIPVIVMSAQNTNAIVAQCLCKLISNTYHSYRNGSD